MPTSFPASRSCWLFCCVTLAATVVFPSLALGQKYVEIAAPAAATDSSSSKKITVHLWVIEAETEKLRNLGFDWSQITSGGKWVTKPISTAGDVAGALVGASVTDEFQGFLKALEQNNLARTLAEPTIVTLSGRKASLHVGQTKLEVTPTALDDQRVELQYQIALSGETEAPTSTHFTNGSTVQVEAGKLCFVSHTRSSSKSANGKRRQTEMLLLVQADYLTR